MATAIRTIVVLIFAWLMVFVTGAEAGISNISSRTLLFLVYRKCFWNRKCKLAACPNGDKLIVALEI